MESYILSNIPRLSRMILSNNSINSIASDAFNKCPRLIEIDLSNNLISHITNDTFLNIGPKITRIILNNNLIELLQWNQLPSTLRTIELSNNLITRIDSAFKSNIKYVKVLFFLLTLNHILLYSRKFYR